MLRLATAALGHDTAFDPVFEYNEVEHSFRQDSYRYWMPTRRPRIRK